jgi:hypothetical protein
MMAGRVEFTGFVAGLIAAVGFEFTGPADPAELLAVTDASRVCPWSEDVATYDADVAPAIGAQPLPLPSQRAQAYLNDVGPLSQLPFDVVSVLPTYAWPLTVGAAVFTGAVADDAAVASAAVTHATTTAIPINVNLFIVFIVFPFRFESTPYAALVPDLDDEHTSSFGSANVTDV